MEDTLTHRIVGIRRGANGDESFREFWTEEQRAAARPLPMPRPEPASRPWTPPAGADVGCTSHGEGRALRSPAEPYAPVPGGNPVSAPLSYPYSACGKLFLTQGQAVARGSAAMISANIALTAGHCVYNQGVWSTRVQFCPGWGHRSSTDPVYAVNYDYLACWTAWSQNGNVAFDYGMIWFDSAPGNTTGWLGTLWNASTANRLWDAVGYPGLPSPPFNENIMDESLGAALPGAVTGTVGLSNDNMEEGSSGGPWLTDYNGSPRVYANGVQSFYTQKDSSTLYGPYFTQDLNGLMNWIANPANRT